MQQLSYAARSERHEKYESVGDKQSSIPVEGVETIRIADIDFENQEEVISAGTNSLGFWVNVPTPAGGSNPYWISTQGEQGFKGESHWTNTRVPKGTPVGRCSTTNEVLAEGVVAGG